MSTSPPASRRRRAAAALQRSTGALSTAATTRMASDMVWFAGLSAQDRSWVGVILQAGIRQFVEWYDTEAPAREAPLTAAIFGSAPRELTRVITLQQTVEMIRLSIDIVEANIDEILHPDDAPEVHEALLRYAREVAFASAEVYARAAESRGAWDARLEALVVDAVLRAEPDDAVLSRANALGWDAAAPVAVVIGSVPSDRSELDNFDDVRRAARAHDMDAMCAAQGERLVVILGSVEDPRTAASHVADRFGPGPVVVGPVMVGLSKAHLSARAASSAYRSAAGWPAAPRPVSSGDLLAERALAGDGHARRHLVEEVYMLLADGKETLLETLSTWLELGSSIEATARALFVHPNTVRYRLGQVAEITGLSPGQPRDAFTLHIALVLGQQSGRRVP
ncbi:MAG: PucR family transcriptional regulator [Nocardioides sp.]|uniref:PucR family transcriptional regulator n=1 Tax=Nocardioides sp. TaxID=35761 RepID=UPI003F12B5E1